MAVATSYYHITLTILEVSFFYKSLPRRQFSQEHPLSFDTAQTISYPYTFRYLGANTSSHLALRSSRDLVVEGRPIRPFPADYPLIISV